MIELTTGNIIQADADALVNTVNTSGVMGKGIALQFKLAFPDMFKKYATDCKQQKVQLRQMHVYNTGAVMSPHYIINFPTKAHWTSKSSIDDIEAGLHDLARVICEFHIQSIAIPPLGCGLGGLRWHDVLPLIQNILEPLTDVKVLVYRPEGAPPAGEIVTNTPDKPLTIVRAAIVKMLAVYNQTAHCATRLEAQKLAYFLTEAGLPTSFQFAKNQYGPYAHNAHQAILALEGLYLKGYGDGCGGVKGGWANIMVIPSSLPEVNHYLVDYPDVETAIDRVDELVTSFETPLGMELLATIHWISVHEDVCARTDVDALIKGIQNWSSRKAKLFKLEHIVLAHTRLREQGWI